MSEWRHTFAGNIARQRREVVRLEPGGEYRTMGVRWYGKGAYSRGLVTTDTVKAKFLYRARKGDFTFNRIDTQKGAFDVVPAELDGALVTNEFPLYEVNKEEVDARFLLLNFQRSEVLQQIGVIRAGSEGRARWKEADFEAWMVPVPPLSVQEQIVEVIGAIDDHITALDAEADSLADVMTLTLSQLLQPGDGWDDVAIGDLAETRTGRAFPNRYQGNANGEVPYFKVADMNAPANSRYLTTPSNWLDSDGIAAVKPRICPPGTIVFPILGAALSTEKRRILVQSSAFDQNLMGLVPSDRVAPEYLLAVMSSIRLSDLTQPGAVPSVNQKIVSAIRVPLAPREVQEQIIEAMDAFRSCVDAKHAEASRLRAVRAGLLSGLLDRTIDIDSAEVEV